MEFPPGDGVCPDPKPAWKALEKFWKTFQKHLPSSIDEDAKCKIQKAAQRFAGQWRVSQKRLDRPAVVAALLAPWDRESKITQKWWSDDTAERQKIRAAIVALHEDFHADVVEPYLAAWRQYVYRLSIRLLTRARDVPPPTSAAAELAELRRPAQPHRAGAARERRRATGAAAEVPVSVRGRVPGHRSRAGRDRVLAGRGHGRRVDGDARRIRQTGGRCRFAQGRSSSSATRSSRSTGSAAPTSTSTTSSASASATKGVGVVLPLTMNFRSVPELCKWANAVFETRFPTEPTAHSPRFAPLDPKPKQAVRGEVCTLTHHCDKAAELPSEDAAADRRPTSGRRSMPAGGTSATS